MARENERRGPTRSALISDELYTCTLMMRKDKSRLLLFTQDPRLVETAKTALESDCCHLVEVRETGVLPALLERGADLVIVDLNLPQKSLENGTAILNHYRDLPILVLSSSNTTLWDQLSRGSPLEEVLESPFSPEELHHRAEHLLSKSHFLHRRLVSRSELMQEVRERILLIAPTPVTVLITGESGTGKDVVARALHQCSNRYDHPFKPINCAAIPENLLENELFGHEKGAFTDAKTQYRGIFEQADGGTVFLDEIGEMTLMAQVRLLRVLEEREVTRIGGDLKISVDIRLIAATNKNLQQAVSTGAFRRDLYYRLKVVELNLPPLRQHREDVPLLIEHFIDEITQGSGTRFDGFSPAAMDLLMEYDWPGNVRELRNLIEHLVILGPRGQVKPEDLLPHLESSLRLEHHLPVPTNKTPDQSERELIYFALLDLKREVSDLRRLVEDRILRPIPSSVRPIYQIEEPSFAASVSEGAAEEAASLPRVRPLKEVEKEEIERAIERVRGNRRRAAEMLGIGVRTLYRKLDEYGLK